MPRGGHREGAGRPAGSKNKGGRPRGAPNRASRERAERAVAEGHTLPAEGLLQVFEEFMEAAEHYRPYRRDPGTGVWTVKIEAGDEEKFILYLSKATEAAAKAAPYYHHRLSALKVSMRRIPYEEMDDSDLDALERIFTAFGRREGIDGPTPSPGTTPQPPGSDKRH